MNPSTRMVLALVGVIAVAGLAIACGEPFPTSETSDVSLAVSRPEDPSVSGVDPSAAPQDTTLDVDVFGANFDDGSTVQFLRDGRPTKKLATNHTTFVAPGQLRANVTIAFDADTGAYDIEVTTSSKRKGVGTEMFSVLKSNNGGGNTIPVQLSQWAGAVWSPAGGLSGEITADGRLFLVTDPTGRGKKYKPGQELCIDLSTPSSVGIVDQTTYALFVEQVRRDQGLPAAADMAAVCTVVTLHTRDHSNYPEEDKMAGQTVGVVANSGGKIVLKDFATGSDSWEWRLMFDAAAAAEPSAPHRGQGVCIDRPDATTWHVYNADTDMTGAFLSSCAGAGIHVDNIGELWRFVRSQPPEPGYWVHVADFVIPFRFVVTQAP